MSDENATDFRLLKILHHNLICLDPSCIRKAKESNLGSGCWKYFADLPVEKYLELITGHFYKSCLDPWWTEIKEGRKLFEGRIRTKIWKYIKKGHLITFINQNDQRFTVKVIKVHSYLNFNAAYAIHRDQLIPEPLMDQNRTADQIYHDLLIDTAYHGDEEQYQMTLGQSGVVAIEMEIQ